MTPELQQYLEREYSEFEQRHFRTGGFWRAPLSALKDTTLFLVFEQFCTLFPDHPTEDNTLFYLVRGPRSGGHTLFLVCTHFEHTSLTDIRALAQFLEEAGSRIEHDGGTTLDTLAAETLMVCFYEPTENIVGLIQQHATRAAA